MNSPFSDQLADLECPQCHSAGPLTLEITTRVTTYYSGASSHLHHLLSEEDPCRCAICQFKSHVKDFRIAPTTPISSNPELEVSIPTFIDESLDPEGSDALSNLTEDQIRDAARRVYASPSDDDIEIDENAIVNKGTEASWVQAWVWVHHSDIGAIPEPF